jgi:phosphate transport system permease protein
VGARLDWVDTITRRHRLVVNIVVHTVLFSLSLLLAYMVRFEIAEPKTRWFLGSFLPWLPVFVIPKLIIFGRFGFAFFVITLGMGVSILAGALTLALMVLPTVIRTTEEAIRAVPRSYRDVSYGLGATRWRMVTGVVLRSALPGIVTGVVLSVGRSISETAAVILTAGSALGLPQSVFDSSRTLALHFYILSREGLSMTNAYATASVLILAIILINLTAYWLMRRFVAKVA